VPLPLDHDTVVRTAVFLIGNVARDEAQEILVELRPPAPSSPPPEPPPSAPPEEQEPLRAWWVGASIGADMVAAPSAADVCLTPSSGWTCLDGNARFPASADEASRVVPGRSDRLSGGLGADNARVLVSVDHVVDDHLLLGGRIGFTTAPYPLSSLGSLKSLHLEARATFVAGKRPFASSGVFPVVVLGAGFAEYATSIGVTAVEQQVGGGGAFMRTADAWRSGGPLFTSLGAGLRLAIGGVALSLIPLKGTVAFGSSSVVALSPEAAVQVGF
jgi:hypothetical protein